MNLEELECTVWRHHPAAAPETVDAILAAARSYAVDVAVGRERLEEAAAEAFPRANAARCGTESGYKRHLRTREAPCDLCRAAHAAYNLGRYHARREPK